MSLFSREVPAEKQITIDELMDKLGSQWSTQSGVSVTPENAMRCATVFAVVRVLSSALSQLPLGMFRKQDKSREKITDHPLIQVLDGKPNKWQSPADYWSLVITNLLLWGNFYAFKQKGRSGPVRGLQPIDPSRVQVEQKDNLDLVYKITQKGGSPSEFRQDQIHHIRGLSINGFVGISPVEASREVIGIAIAAQKMAASLFGNGAVPYVVIEHPGTFKDDSVYARFKESWQKAFGLSDGHARSTAILEGGMKVSTIQMNSKESQFLESRKFQKEEIAAIFGVPPHMVAQLERATFSNIEQQSLEFVTNSLMPYLVRIEDAVQRDLIDDDDLFIKFNVDGLLRGDIKSRSQALDVQRRNGVINANEWRKIEDMNPREDEGGEEYLIPVNMTDQPLNDDKDDDE